MDRLHWQCRRGMLELDELLGQFLDAGYQQLQPDERLLFNELLRESDVDLHQWLLAGGQYPVCYGALIDGIKRRH